MEIKNTSSVSGYLSQLTDQLENLYHRMQDDGSFKAPIAYKSFKLDTDALLKDSIEKLPSSRPTVLIAPCLQLYKHHIKQDSYAMEIIMSTLQKSADTDRPMLFCTSYFNPTVLFKKLLSSSGLPWKILTAAPSANSFYNSKGASSIIPELYQHNLHGLMRKLKNAESSCQFFEYSDPGKTFHAKGSLRLQIRSYFLKLSRNFRIFKR